MAVQPIVLGACEVKIASGSGSLETLGYTADGARVTVNPYSIDVPSDREGGESGPPRDVQFVGVDAEIYLELTEWEASVGNKIMALIPTLTLGTWADSLIGQLYRTTSNQTTRICLDTPTTPWNFPTCIIRNAFEINRGVRHSRLIVRATAYRWSSGVLFNNTDS